jgi:LacI family transcriptional regulator
MTASRTLRDDPRVSRDKRQRVLDAVQTLGYRRNETARNLRLGGTSGLLGLVVTNLANPFYSQFTLGVEAVAGTAGLQVVLANTDDNVARERQVVTELVARGVDGMIVVPAGSDHGHLHPDRIDGVPIVLGARPPTDVPIDCVLVDDFGGARTATARLTAQGHERIGFLGPPPSVWTSSERFRGFCVALDEAGITLDESHVRLRQRTIEAAEGATRDLLRLPDPPTAFFCANSRNTLGAFRALRACGTPAGLAGFDDFEVADVLGMHLIIVAYDPAELGRRAARLLLERMDRRDTQPAISARRVVVGTTVVEYGAERPDTAPPRRATVG